MNKITNTFISFIAHSNIACNIDTVHMYCEIIKQLSELIQLTKKYRELNSAKIKYFHTEASEEKSNGVFIDNTAEIEKIYREIIGKRESIARDIKNFTTSKTGIKDTIEDIRELENKENSKLVEEFYKNKYNREIKTDAANLMFYLFVQDIEYRFKAYKYLEDLVKDITEGKFDYEKHKKQADIIKAFDDVLTHITNNYFNSVDMIFLSQILKRNTKHGINCQTHLDELSKIITLFEQLVNGKYNNNNGDSEAYKEIAQKIYRLYDVKSFYSGSIGSLGGIMVNTSISLMNFLNNIIKIINEPENTEATTTIDIEELTK